MDHIHHRPAAQQTIATSHTTVASTTPFFDARIKLRVICTVNSWVTISPLGETAPVVGGGATYMAAGFPEVFHCRQGDVVSALTDTAGSTGFLNVSEMQR